MWTFWQRRRQWKQAQALYERGLAEKALPLFEGLAAARYCPREVALYRAAALYTLKRYAEAKEILSPLAAEAAPGALVDFMRGKIAAAEGDWDTAFSLARRAFEQDTFNTRIEYFLGLCYLQRGDTERAADHFESAIRYDRQWVDTRLLLWAETALLRSAPGSSPDKIFF